MDDMSVSVPLYLKHASLLWNSRPRVACFQSLAQESGPVARGVDFRLLSCNLCCLVIFVLKLIEVVDALTTLLLHRRAYCARVKSSCRSFLAVCVPESVLKPSCSRAAVSFCNAHEGRRLFYTQNSAHVPDHDLLLAESGMIQICDFVSAMFSTAC